MRGVRLEERKALYSLDGGFKVFQQFRPKLVERARLFQSTPDPPNMFSSGINQLDEILNGGYLKGATILVNIGEDISAYEYHLLGMSSGGNFLAKGRPVIVIPSGGEDAASLSRVITQAGFSEDEVNRLLMVCMAERELDELSKPQFIWTFEVEDLWESMEEFFGRIRKLSESTGQPALLVVGVDALFGWFGLKDLARVLNVSLSLVRKEGYLGILLLQPGIPQPSIYEMLNAIVDVHFRIVKEHGVLLFYGVKPRTGLYAVDVDTTQGYLMPKLTPIV